MAAEDTETAMPVRLHSCPCCGLSQAIPPLPPRTRACCARCGTCLIDLKAARLSDSRTAAIALAALILYPLAITLPMIEVERFGHRHAASIIEGVATLLGSGHVIVGLVVLACSIVFPLGKLVALLLLTTGAPIIRRDRRALTHRIVQWTGRWGMLDVLLVAVLVAAIKIGDVVQVTAGPAALAFTACVLLSLLAAASFNPHATWMRQELAAPADLEAEASA